MKKLFLILSLLTAVGVAAVSERDKSEIGFSKNFIGNGGIESGKAGFLTYADAAGSQPVDGLNGSPSSTLTTSASNPLAGNNSIIWTKSANNRQGEGFTYAFALDTASKATPLAIQFDYQITSGTYADGDMTVYVYDSTSIIQPAPYQINNVAGALVGHFSGSFQPNSTATNYYLIIHTASTSASAYTVKFDNFYVGRARTTLGVPVTNWVTYTPTISPISGYTESPVGVWKRDGDTLRVRGYFNKNGSIGVGAGDFTITLPSGLSIDTTKLATTVGNTSNLGTFNAFNVNLASNYDRLTNIGYASTTTVLVTKAGSGGNLVGTDIGAGAYVSWDFAVPILGWSSSVTMSNDSDTRVVSMRSGGTATTISGSAATIVFSTVAHDTHNAYSAGTYTVPVSGYYKVNSNLRIQGTYALNTASNIYAQKNGSTVIRGNVIAGGAQAEAVVSVAGTILCNAGDTLRIQADTGATGPSIANATESAFFVVDRISGPAVIAASETIAVKYVNTAGTSITTSFATIPFATKVYDTHGSFNGSTFTAPSAGKYQVCFNLISAAVTNTTSQFWADQFLVTSTPESLSGATELVDQIPGTGASENFTTGRCKTYSLFSGDTIAVQATNGVATTLSSTAGRNWITVEKVAN